MTINFISTKKLALLCTAVCATMLAFSNNAAALTIGDEHELGFGTNSEYRPVIKTEQIMSII